MAPPINVQDWYGDRHTCQIASGALGCSTLVTTNWFLMPTRTTLRSTGLMPTRRFCLFSAIKCPSVSMKFRLGWHPIGCSWITPRPRSSRSSKWPSKVTRSSKPSRFDTAHIIPYHRSMGPIVTMALSCIVYSFPIYSHADTGRKWRNLYIPPVFNEARDPVGIFQRCLILEN